jgi:hypothetical protein
MMSPKSNSDQISARSLMAADAANALKQRFREAKRWQDSAGSADAIVLKRSQVFPLGTQNTLSQNGFLGGAQLGFKLSDQSIRGRARRRLRLHRNQEQSERWRQTQPILSSATLRATPTSRSSPPASSKSA